MSDDGAQLKVPPPPDPGLYKRLQDLEALGIRPPKGYDLMDAAALETWLKEKEGSEEVQKRRQDHARRQEVELARASEGGLRRDYLKKIAEGFLTYDEGKKKWITDYPALASWLIDYFHVVSYGGEAWLYMNGVYVRDDHQLRCMIDRIYTAAGSTGARDNQKKELVHQIIDRAPEREYPFNPRPDLVPVRNGVIRLGKGRQLLPHSPEYRFTYQLPVDYDPAAPREPVRMVLASWTGEEGVRCLIQFPAQALAAASGEVYKRMYIFEGEHDAGKSTYFLMVEMTFGTGIIAGVDLYALCRDKFALSNLEFKLMNIHDDMESISISHVGKVKNISGKTLHRIERKGKDGYDGRITAVHAFSCNRPPSIGPVEDDAFWSRWNYVEFPSAFSRDPSWPARTFTPAFLSGFLNLILDTLEEMLAKGHTLLVQQTPDQVKDAWIRATDPLADMLEEMTVKSEGCHIRHDVFYPALVRFCQEKGLKVNTKARVTVLMDTLGYHTTQVRDGTDRPRVYQGLRWKEGCEPNTVTCHHVTTLS